jgi:hypothetical protein
LQWWDVGTEFGNNINAINYVNFSE